MNDFESVESSLKNNLPEGEYEQVRRILYGKDCKGIRSENIPHGEWDLPIRILKWGASL